MVRTFLKCPLPCRQFHRKQCWYRWGSAHRLCASSWHAIDQGAHVGRPSYDLSHTCNPHTWGRLARHEHQVLHCSRCQHQRRWHNLRDRTDKKYVVFQCSCFPLGNFTVQVNTRRFTLAYFPRDPYPRQCLRNSASPRVCHLDGAITVHDCQDLSSWHVGHINKKPPAVAEGFLTRAKSELAEKNFRQDPQHEPQHTTGDEGIFMTFIWPEQLVGCCGTAKKT